MTAANNYLPTYCFRLFRRKHSSISRIYWTIQLGIESVTKLMVGQNDNDFVVDCINPTFEKRMLPDSRKEFCDQSEDRMGLVRLYLLLICSANLESYLQDAATLFVADQGYEKGPYQLNEVGNALAAPVTAKSTIPDMIEYVQQLMKIDLSTPLAVWKKAYKLRCHVAHVGTFANAKLLKKIPDLKIDVGGQLNLKWSELNTYLAAADDIATGIDRKVSRSSLRTLEAKWILFQLKDAGLLPERSLIWAHLHDEYGLMVSNPNKRIIEKELYKIKT